MKCPKCKKEIPEESLKCTYCNARVGSFCKKCNSYNIIYNLNCLNCGNELLKRCPSCNSINLPNTQNCRKCGFDFIKPQENELIIEEEIEPQINMSVAPEVQVIQTNPQETYDENNDTEEIEIVEDENQIEQTQNENLIDETEDFQGKSLSYQTKLYSQQTAKDLLKEAILSENKKFLSLSGAKGSGKTVVLKSVINETIPNKLFWLFGECSPITQISPGGLIQNILLTFFNVPAFCLDSLQLKKDSHKFFHNEFPTLTNDEIFNLLNFLYPTSADYFENILKNKDKTFAFLKKVFKTIIDANRTILIAEHYEFIDGFSQEFLQQLSQMTFPTSEFKILLTYNDITPIQSYFYDEKLQEENYFNISLDTFDNELCATFIDRFFEKENCPDNLKFNITKLSNGNPAILEQYLNLIKDNGNFELDLPLTFKDVMNSRFNLLKKNPVLSNTLIIASIQGINFSPEILNQVLKLENEDFSKILNTLQEENFILQISPHFFAFKNSYIWEEIFEISKHEPNFAELNSELFDILSGYILSSNSTMALIAQNIGQDLSSFNYWTDNTKISAFIGDTNLYIVSQKQSLKLIEKLETSNNSLMKSNIFERLGKILSKTNPQEAMEYLPTEIESAHKFNQVFKVIELTGYLAECCIKLGNYHGVIECVDSIIESLDSEFELEIAMLKARKLNALLKLGNCGEIVNMTDNEILPVFDKYLNMKPHKNISIRALYKTWLESYLVLANALIFQGNNRGFEVLNSMFEIFEKNKFEEPLFICKTNLALALANTLKGDIRASEDILEKIIKTYKPEILDTEAICRWNFINILNKFFEKNYADLKDELFQVVSYANNVNDMFTKNILKTLLGKLYKNEDNSKQALKIYAQQITYFSKEKSAIGALLCWYLISEANLVAEGPEKALEVARKALEVAQSPRINNYLFITLYNKAIAEACIVQGEYELAKVHIEQGILIARKFELLSVLTDLYLLYGKYLQDLAVVNKETNKEYILGSAKMYKRALDVANKNKNPYLISCAQKAQTVLKSFCEMNNIIIDTKEL